jgi:hypothetical protein
LKHSSNLGQREYIAWFSIQIKFHGLDRSATVYKSYNFLIYNFRFCGFHYKNQNYNNMLEIYTQKLLLLFFEMCNGRITYLFTISTLIIKWLSLHYQQCLFFGWKSYSHPISYKITVIEWIYYNTITWNKQDVANFFI